MSGALLPLWLAGLSVFGPTVLSQELRSQDLLGPAVPRATPSGQTLSTDPKDAKGMTELARRYEVGDGCPRDAGRAILLYKRAALLGEPGAMIALGSIYDEGKCVDQNTGEAIRLYRAAAALGSAEAMYHVGRMIEGGRGVRRSPEESVSWYQKAADKQFGPAFTRLGDLSGDASWYQKAVAAGDPTAYAKLAARLDSSAARELLRKGVAAKDPEAIYRLGVLDKSDALIRQAADMNHPAAMGAVAVAFEKQGSTDAIIWYNRAADAGDPVALTWAAKRIEGQNLEQAMEMYERASQANYPVAMTRLGAIKADCRLFRRAGELGDAEGSYSYATKCNPADASDWLERAASGRHPEALARLGRVREAAEAGHRPSLLALAKTEREWVRRAADAGIPEALRMRAADFEDPGERVRWIQRAAEAGDVPAMSQLGLILEEGRGVLKDRSAALRWYEPAAAGGDRLAMYRLGVLSGNQDWIRKAADAGHPEAMVKAGESASSKDEAMVWFQRAAAAGHANAWTRLGALAGDSALLQKAADAGDAEAKLRLGDLARDQKQAKKAYLLYRAAADAGSAQAMMRAGDCHMNGWGASRSEVDAVNWYRKAALAGSEEAIAKLRQLGKTQ